MIILPISASTVNLENAGGKGASLSRLTRLGYPVPPGYIITTEAYNKFVKANDLAGLISSSIRNISDDIEKLENASSQIRAAFSNGILPLEIADAFSREYRSLDPHHEGVAVRSSATTEDLPDLSFAGQQDTSLNVVTEEQLRLAVINCWSSLWTERAIGYRMRNDIPHEIAALAIVVQRMVSSEVSGVLFTANPLTGLLTESVIDATFGLGEALVSGRVEPDHFIVDSREAKIRELTLGSKKTVTRMIAGGGVESVQEKTSDLRTLNDGQVHQLVAAGQQIQKELGSPQDIEWAFSSGKLFILQSRPITSLFPVPRISHDPLLVWFSFGSFQGILGPMTPLGQEAIQRVVLGVGNKIGVKIKYSEQDILVVSGERIWVKISDLIRNPLGNRILKGFLGIGEPGTAQILERITTDQRFGAGQGRIRLGTILRLLKFMSPALALIPRSILHPEKARNRFEARLEAYLQTVSIPPGADRFEQLANVAAFMAGQGGLADALPVVLPLFMPIMAPSLAALKLIGHLLPPDASGKRGISISVLDVTRGLPHNITTSMDLDLWQTANLIREDVASAGLFSSEKAENLARFYLEGTLPSAAQGAISRFLERYGDRCAGEIDLGRQRWREDPLPILQTLQSYLGIPPEAAPDLVFERNVQAAEEAIEKMVAEVRGQRGGRLREKLLRAAARRVRMLLGARESPKFMAVRAMGIVRNAVLETGREFAAAGTISLAEDLFFLHVEELGAMSRREERDWKGLIAGRRQAYLRETRRRQIPRLLVSDGRTFYDGGSVETDTDDLIAGSPVSPGVVEGIVHVVHDPHGVQMHPGEILVCPGTDPAWTPLFMAAGGLVMEVGGMMTHGSVVAREYGIPAVVGVRQATLRLKDGHRIRVDGTNGTIAILQEPD